MNKIIVDCERMKYADTGIYHYCLQLGLHMLQVANKNDNLSFYLPEHLKGIFGIGLQYITQNSLQKFWLPSLTNYDIWHCTFQNSQYLPVLNRKIKVLLTIHDLNFLYDDTKTHARKEKHVKKLQANIDRSDAVVCISEFSKNDIQLNCDLGKTPLHVIYNGSNNLQPGKLNGSSYRPKTRFLFSIGSVNRKKNFHVLLPLLQKNTDMELLIAGRRDDEDYIDYLNKSAQHLGVEDQVRVLGSISEFEKSWYYNNCYAFAFPSLAEGFGLPVTEAMSVGKPLFLSDRTALPEIGKDVAFYFDDFKADKMQEVFKNGMNQYKKENMELAIKERSNQFSWDKAAKEYLKIYHTL
ncbi:MAG: glycosyltransferase family 1 protein [Ginsengibacter sp.]